MKNIAKFEGARNNINLMFELWEKLEGNAQSFEPIRNMKASETCKAVLSRHIDRFTKTGKPMIEATWTDLETGRSATVYQWRPKDYDQYKDMKVGDVCLINSQENKGFFNVKILKNLAINMDIPPKPNGLSKGVKRRTVFLYDIEVFKYDILIELRDYFTKEWYEFENDLDGFRKFYLENRDSLFVGYNNGGYDNHVVRGYLQGKDPYELSKTIIDSEDRNAIYKKYNNNKTTLFSLDLYMDNKGVSLKEHCGFMGIDIRETQVDFDIDRPLTPDEQVKNRFYCRNDVLGTEKRLEQNSSMLLAKMAITGMFDLDKTAIGMTNANLTGLLLKAVKTADRKDETEPYEIPECLEIEDEQVLNNYVDRTFNYLKDDKLDISIEVNRRDLVEIMGAGGLHGAKQGYINIGKFHMRDVGSLYPNTMILFNHMSRNIPEKDLHIYSDLLQERMDAKYSNEKFTSIKGVQIPKKSLVTGIKLPLNTKYGAMGAKFNVLFDKRMRLHVCITGQLAMFDLLEKIEPHATIIQSNTDCHAFIPFSEEDAKEIDKVCNDWQERTGYKLDDDIFQAIYQANVNNYIAIDENNHVKVKGAVSLGGGIKISNAIVSNAFINYVVSGKDYNEFINECDELRQYQMITKTGYTFDRTVTRDSDGNEKDAQKVNRVFAVKDPSKAVVIYKVKENVFTSKADVIKYVKDANTKKDNSTLTDLAKLMIESEEQAEDVQELIEKYNENKDENGVWEWIRYTKGLNNAPDHYAISNEAIGEGITIDEIDKSYYVKQVEDLIVQWFGNEYETRLNEAHKHYVEQGFDVPPVKNYID